jgi:hypothetical protein
MSSTARERKARQIRISNVNREVIHKACLQKIKDELRAEERRKLREEREREVERLIGETRLRDEASHRPENKDQAVVLCSFFLSVLYFCLMCSFFFFDIVSSQDETKALGWRRRQTQAAGQGRTKCLHPSPLIRFSQQNYKDPHR